MIEYLLGILTGAVLFNATVRTWVLDKLKAARDAIRARMGSK